jgi:signal recognition particle receptor subunit beta
MTSAGKPGLRVRRGLGTADEHEANTLVEQLNQILTDQTLWTLAARLSAEQRFDKRIVAAFYDSMTPAQRDNWQIRDQALPMPGPAEDYVRVLLLGTTGAGKTTLVRQLIGTDPERERFPSVSAAKTTICSTEIIPRVGDYTAVVTFLPRDHVRLAIEECVMQAAVAHIDKNSHETVVQRFLEHADQRFRLSYLLGTKKTTDATAAPNEELTDDAPDSPLMTPDDPIGAEEETALKTHLSDYLSRTQTMAESSRTNLQAALELSEIDARKDWDVFQELFEENVQEMPEFADLVDEILEDVETRFRYVDQGKIEYGGDNWPINWQFTTPDRKLFLKTVNRFSSNYAPHFGRLLTPLVEGIRVAGPFIPEWPGHTEPLPMVLVDGEGLGHTADSASSISTAITRRFDTVDVVLLVDNAAQPLQAAPSAVLRSLTSSGHESKLVVAFTHFDDVIGPNLGSTSARKTHVLSSLENAINDIGRTLNRNAENALRRATQDRVFFLSSIQERVQPTARLTLSELAKFVDTIKRVGTPPPPSEATPVYDDANLVLSIQSALQDFHEPWRARLGFPSKAPLSPKHWATIKALARRLGVLGEDQFDDLRPVADLIARLQEHISLFIGAPLAWDPENAPDEIRHTAIDAVSRSVFTRLHVFCASRLFITRVKDWNTAFSHTGKGSSYIRAREIRSIYETAAPIPGEVPAADANQFLTEIRQMVREAIEAGGGVFRKL